MDISADYSKVETGVWTPTFKGASFLVAHTSNLKFQRALARLQQPYNRKIKEGTLDPAKHKEIICEAMAEGLVYDWSGVTEKGEAVKYSKDLCKKALLRDPEFRDFVSEFAQTLANFIEEEVVELGNG